jgi:ABC-2 type transport system permease protein
MAGLNGAGINGAGAGLGSALARAQYRALAAMRWAAFRNGMRSKLGAFELGARTFTFLLYGLIAISVSFGLGIAAWALVANHYWGFVPLLFWLLCVMWQMVPVMLASFQEQFDLSILLRFPVSFSSYFLLYLLFGLVDVSSLLGGLCSLGLFVGITIARPDLFIWTALALAFFALFNILLSRAVFAWIDRWLAQRRTREILGAVFLLLALSMQLLNPALHAHRHSTGSGSQSEAQQFRNARDKYEPMLKTANAVQKWLPPGAAAEALRLGGKGELVPAIANLGLLGFFALVAGAVLSARLKAEYRGENLGSAPAVKKTEAIKTDSIKYRPSKLESARLRKHSGPIAAIIEKEVFTLMRSLPLLYALGTPLFLVVIWSTMYRNSVASTGFSFSFPYALPLGMAYALLGFTQFIYNSLGGEGAGIQLYFLSPTPIRTVLLAKNCFHSLLFAVDALVAGLLITMRMGFPGAAMLAATLGWVAFALPTQLATGNLISLMMPYRINPGRITRQRGSPLSALLSLLIQVAVIGLGAGVFAVSWLAGNTWLAVPIFLVLSGGAIFAWLRVLYNADRLANQRRDSLIGLLAKIG